MTTLWGSATCCCPLQASGCTMIKPEVDAAGMGILAVGGKGASLVDGPAKAELSAIWMEHSIGAFHTDCKGDSQDSSCGS